DGLRIRAASSSQPGRSAWRATSRASRGERLQAAAAGRHASLRLQARSTFDLIGIFAILGINPRSDPAGLRRPCPTGERCSYTGYKNEGTHLGIVAVSSYTPSPPHKTTIACSEATRGNSGQL